MPIIYCVYESFGDGERSWGSADAYRQALSGESLWIACQHSLVLAAFSSAGTVAIGLILAVAASYGKGSGWGWDTVLYLPLIVPSATIAAAWGVGLEQYTGLVPSFLKTLGLDFAQNLVSDRTTVVYTLAAILILQSTGWPYLILRRAIQRIPQELIDGARTDGVSERQLLLRIVIPLIRTSLAAALAIQLIWGFLVFDQVRILTNGGPGTASDVVSTLIYREAFERHNLSIACSMSVIVLAFVAPLSIAISFRQDRIGELHSGPTEQSQDQGRLATRSWQLGNARTARLTLVVWSLLSCLPVAIVAVVASSDRGMVGVGGDVGFNALRQNVSSAISGPTFGQPFSSYALNSLFVGVGATVCALGIACSTAYWLLLSSPLVRRVVRSCCLVGISLPGIVTWIPVFQAVSQAELLNSRVILAVVYASLQVPLAVLLVDAVLSAVNPELLEAARVDGASEVQIAAQVVFPCVKSGVASVALILFGQSWCEFGLASVLLRRSAAQTLPVAMGQMGGQFSQDRGGEAAMVLLAILTVLVPVAIAFVASRVYHRIESSPRWSVGARGHPTNRRGKEVVYVEA
jgi:ABC-type sugar transport system permease subunit